MKAAIMYETGQKVPRYGDFDDPTPGENETLVKVRAAGLHPIVRSMAAGMHYGSGHAYPFISGVDGIAETADGRRIYFGGLKAPYGTMAEKAVTRTGWAIEMPDSLDDVTAAALFNPAMSGWLSLSWRAELQPGESVLILGATGAAGKLAVQLAKGMGAGRVVAAGRNQAVLDTLSNLGADATIQLDQPTEDLKKAFVAGGNGKGYDVVLDYVWGKPTETLLEAITGHDIMAESARTRIVEIGAMAGPNISLPAAALRSSRIELYGSGGGSVPHQVIFAAFPKIIGMAASGQLKVDSKAVPLAQVEEAWQRSDSTGARIVFVP